MVIDLLLMEIRVYRKALRKYRYRRVISNNLLLMRFIFFWSVNYRGIRTFE